MPLSAKILRLQMNRLKPLLRSCSLETIRKGQNRIGELMESRYRQEILFREHSFPEFEGGWMIPKDERRQGVILYLHGGGYTCGDLEYAKGFGSALAVECGTRVFCAAYRLAPEAPYPAAIEDAFSAYQYLLGKGYDPSHILLCGESAGGGLCYSLCLKLRQMGMEMPAAIIALSPWTDLTASGDSYERNRDADPSMMIETLNFFAECYTINRTDPMVSPLFGDLEGMPPSLILVGGDEIMLSDSQSMAEKLLCSGCQCRLIVKPDRWHAYLLYGLKEDAKDFTAINQFLSDHFSREKKLRWMRLDNAAKIYPASRNQNWSNVFRLSATMTETVDVSILQSALDVTVRRFPSVAARLRRGVFWYYLQELSEVPEVRSESSYPLTKMSRDEVRKCAIRVIVYDRRIAVELFHSITDGNGALVFLKSLVAEYIQQKYGVHIPAEQGVMGRLEEVSEEELEDSFQKYAGNRCASRQGTNAWKVIGTPEPDDFKHITCMQMPVDAVLKKAHEHHVTLTTFLCAVTMQALQNLQKAQVPNLSLRRPIKVLLPVNLRKIFPSRSLRNFALYTTPEIDPRLGEYSFREICDAVRHKMGMEVNSKYMGSLIATNIGSERLLAVRLMPLFIKNFVMKMVFNAVGERKSCLSLSNLGAVRIPAEMETYVERFDFILGVQASAPYNCGVLSYKDTLYLNTIRDIREPYLEYHLYCVLRDMGIPVSVESNRAQR